MTKWYFKFLFAVAMTTGFASLVTAAELQVRPVLIDVTAPGVSSTLTLTNKGTEKVNAQIRVFRWSQVNGQDKLVPTRDVVVSPPFIKMKSGGSYTVRVIKVSKKPLRGEESFRLIVDQIPDINVKSRNVAVKFNVRYSIPVFFSPTRVSAPKVSWSYATKNGWLALSARNTGGSRLRVSNLKIKSGGGTVRTISPGLAGYVLAGSSMRWKQRGKLKGARQGVRVLGRGNNEKISAKASLR